MVKNIWFDMDGTIADFYSVDGWLTDLDNENPRPYAEAKPLLNMNSLAKVLNRLHREGWTINIVSWTSKMATEKFMVQIADTKRRWLKKHLASVKFTTIDIIPYGTNKSENRDGILFDDEERNRTTWGENAYDVDNILEILRAIK